MKRIMTKLAGQNDKKGHSATLNVAVIGGGFGREHIKGFLADRERFRLKTFCDQNPETVERIRKEFALPDTCKVCTDFQEVLDDSGIDAVAISLPHHLHEPVAVEAAKNKKHLLLDKPISRTLKEADHIIEAAKTNKVTLMIAHTQRFVPFFQELHAQVASGAIGQPLYAATCHYQNFNPPAGAAWRSKQSVGGGCVIGSGVHNLDMMRWLFGEPLEVFAYSVKDKQRLKTEAAASISFRFKNGLVVNFICNWMIHSNIPWGEWKVFGTRGDIYLNRDDLQVGHEFGRKVERVVSVSGKYENMYTHFYNCITRKTEPLTSGLEGRASLGLVLKIYDSIERGCPVSC